MNAVLYARVSTEKQADKDLSIPAQLQAMRDYARQRDWVVVEEFLEPGVSAKTTERPALQRLLAAVRGSKSKIEVVLVHKIDRLARNVYDHATIRALFQQRQIRLASVVENVDDSVSGQLVENIMASIAQFYSANLGEEVKKGMRQKVLKGGWPHLPPIGYSVTRKGDDSKSIVEFDAERAPLVRLAFELYATGRWGVRALADHLRQQGLHSRAGKTLSQTYVRHLLVNPFYIGQLRWEGKIFPGKHPPLVPVELFNNVQAVVKRRASDPKTKITGTGFPLKAVAVCASCRGSMTAEAHGAWSYYRCCRRMMNKDLCPSRLCNVKLAHDRVKAICQQLRLREPVAARILQAAERQLKRRSEAQSEALRSLNQRRAVLVRREMALTQDFVSEKVTAETYQSLSNTLGAELKQVRGEIDRTELSSGETLDRVRATLQDAADVWDIFGRMSPFRQSELIKAVFKVIALGPTGVVGHVLKEPFASLFSDRPDAEHSGFNSDAGAIERLAERIVAPG